MGAAGPLRSGRASRRTFSGFAPLAGPRTPPPPTLPQSAEAARPRLEQLMGQLRLRGLRPSSLEWAGDNLRYNLLPQARVLF